MKKTTSFELIVNIDASENEFAPSKAQIHQWCSAALKEVKASNSKPFEINIAIITPLEIHTLNKTYRAKDKATNVLSFPNGVDDPYYPYFQMGDIAICKEIVQNEASEQKKSYVDHFAHMIIHATLHLCGLDHIEEKEAEAMEALEIKCLAYFGIANPYGESTA